MKLLSINVGSIQEYTLNNKVVKSGIIKAPINNPVKVYTDHIEGDEQADLNYHGGIHKAVYGFSNHHYSYWEKILNVEKLSPGFYGENLTFDYLKEEELNIGDRIKIGEVILSISQPRSPCYKVSIASENKMTPKMFIESGLSGIYFKVLNEGSIDTNSPISIIPYNEKKISVKDLFTATFGPKNNENANLLQEALNHPELAPAWKNMIKNMIKQ